jgi:hypothetical protein
MLKFMRPEGISRFKKHRFLLGMSEDQFRDAVVRPLFFRQELGDGRDLCGPTENGKDALFVATDKLGLEDVYVVQTKKGNINLARKAQSNLIEAITQLKTASNTKVTFIKTKQKQLPAKVILCVSGKINEAARNHIIDEVKDPRLVFMDSDDLIPKLDELYQELWLGIDANIAPYLRKLTQIIENADETLAIAELLPRDSQASVATDHGFVMLQLYRMAIKIKKQKGQVTKEPELEQMPITGLLNRRSQLFAIFGSAGSGKSTCLKRIAYLLATRGLKFEASDKPTIPVLLRAPNAAGNLDRPLVEICDAETRRLAGVSQPVFSADDLTAGRVFVLIDALDEVPDETSRGGILSSILQFHERYPACKVVVTSRDHHSVQSLAGLKSFETYNLSAINYTQAQQIIKNLQKGKNLPPEKSNELVRRLEQVHGMELNPLLVTVFAATSEYSRQDIPANITELFKKFTEMMLGRWDATKGFTQQYHAPLKDFILTKIAFEMHKERITRIPIGRFEQILRTELLNRGHSANADQLRDEIVNRSGLFSTSESTVEFRHLLIQEFFAGRGIPSAEFLHMVISDPWWTRAVVFYFGEHADDAVSLRSAIATLQGRSSEERFNSALTLGLALQACYLVEVKDKIDIYRWVVDGLSDAKDQFLIELESKRPLPLSRFIFYYLFGRDSVALSVLENRAQEILDGWSQVQLSDEDRELRVFWVLSGLIECGAMQDVERMLRKFKPSDSRLLLGIFLGSYFMQHVRLSNKEQTETAKRICQALAARIAHLRTTLADEWKAELLEVRQGAVKTIEARAKSKEQEHEADT